MSKMEHKYLLWLVDFASELCGDESHGKLFLYLYSREFYSKIGNDYNRAEDGKELRIRFAEEEMGDYRIAENILPHVSCNMLEMLIALSIRCEEQIMWDPEIGDQTGRWFNDMLASLGLDEMTDDEFDEREVGKIIDIFLAHKYNRNGSGGLFTLHRSRRDLRKAEIWYQLNWYLDEVMDT